MDEEATTELKSLTAITLAEKTKLTTHKVRQTMNKAMEIGYVEEGARQHRNKTYYITEKGIKKIEEIGG